MEINDNNIKNEELNILSKKEINANLQAKISIVLLYVPMVLSFITIFLSNLIVNIEILEVIFECIFNIVTNTWPVVYVIGLALMIDVRVKYPKNKMGKIAMWAYIITTILSILLAILGVIFVLWVFSSALNQLFF